MSERLLLDTHVWIWLMSGDARAERSRALKRIERASAENRLDLSWVSIWETAMLEARGRIVLPVPISEWVRRALDAPGIRLADLHPNILIESTHLPEGFHADPMDCILVATARYFNATLVTADRKILAYARRRHLKALAF